MSKQKIIILIIAITLIVIGLIFVVKFKKTTPAVSNNEQSAAQVSPIDATDHVFGDPKAAVQMIVYSDFECPFCAKFAETMKKVEENFKDKIVITFRQYPLPIHPQAEKAAEASECAAEQGKFWEMHDRLFANNIASNMNVEQYKKDAVDLSLNQEQFNQCLDSGKYAEKVSQQKTDGTKAGATGTPTIFVNGNIYPGAYPFEDFISPDGQNNKGMKSIISELL
jgi:protein-disulfide isomerase